jgi:hypothetical protein
MSTRKPRTPEEHTGVFTRYDDIPARYRLETFADAYADDDTTIYRYFETVHLPQYEPVSESHRERVHRACQQWIEHMDSRGRHHALATPTDVNTWCETLMTNRTVATCYKSYYSRIYAFYEYLQRSYRHPHLYNPLLLAAVDHEPTRSIWMERVNDRPQ